MTKEVSTHSRPKAAGVLSFQDNNNNKSFNTQPPEGGWRLNQPYAHTFGCFNTQPPEGGWDVLQSAMDFYFVSTHSRPKAAGPILKGTTTEDCSFNTQPPEGGWNHHC